MKRAFKGYVMNDGTTHNYKFILWDCTQANSKYINELLEYSRESLTGYPQLTVFSAEDKEDIIQDVLLNLYEKLVTGRLNSNASISVNLHSELRLVLARFNKQCKNNPRFTIKGNATYTHKVDAGSEWIEDLLRSELSGYLYDIMKQHYIDDVSVGEIAREYQVTKERIEYMLKKGVQRLRGCIGRNREIRTNIDEVCFVEL